MKAFQLAAPIVPGLAIGKPSPIPLTRFDAAQKAARNGVIGDSARHRIKSASIVVNVTPLRVASVWNESALPLPSPTWTRVSTPTCVSFR